MRRIGFLALCLMGLSFQAHARVEYRDQSRKLIETMTHEGDRDVWRDPEGKALRYCQHESSEIVCRDMTGHRLETYSRN